jgi:hypothetical protein
MSGFPPDPEFIASLFHNALDIGLVLGLFYLMSLIIGEYRTLWMIYMMERFLFAVLALLRRVLFYPSPNGVLLANWELVTERQWALPNAVKIVSVWWSRKKLALSPWQREVYSIVPSPVANSENC